ncbi:restriction endonuclease [Methanogenium organophilum]|uniref:Restriction endonuclease n=1 Tax=Methanogenium organophilum TaxID=2199 RepID=A0A9X9T8U6_METOG|nr:restriction endonuclease [Methanogenium organophilum]WAI01796.1 restriction endonuclease [Methanogenium organophilum]
MEKAQARGYVFEVIIQRLLERSDYFNVINGEIRGRGAKHQIDAYGIFSYPVPFVHPIRIISEVKCYRKNKVKLNHIRNFVGVLKDISENYFVNPGLGVNSLNRYNDAGCFFSATEFTLDAQTYAWAHNIFLISFNKVPWIENIAAEIDSFVKCYYPSLSNISKNDLVTYAECMLFEEWSEDNSYEEYYPGQKKLRSLIEEVSLNIGILNNAYPVILAGRCGWDKRLNIQDIGDLIYNAEKKTPSFIDNSTFHLMLVNDEVVFSIPSYILDNLNSQMNQSGLNPKEFYIDLPVYSQNKVRRIVRINIDA